MNQLTDAQVIEAIILLRSPAYQNLSKFHTDYLDQLEAIAKTRRLTINPLHLQP